MLEANPDLRGVLYDRPEVASTAEVLAAAGIADRAEAVGGDFFESVPEGADRYVVKPSSTTGTTAGDPDPRLRAAGHPAPRPPAPRRPLLPDGDGYDHAVWLDLNMLVMTDGGRERTVAEYRDLLARAGFRLTCVLPTSGPMSVIEAAPAP